MDLATGATKSLQLHGAAFHGVLAFLVKVLQRRPGSWSEHEAEKWCGSGTLVRFMMRDLEPWLLDCMLFRECGPVFSLCGWAVQGVTWTGVLNSRRVALGLKVDWAYAPGEVKVLTSSDGANFEEAKCWQSSTRGEVAFEESFMLDAPRSVKAVSVTMRSPQSWGYFGINSVALIAEPGPFMLVRRGRAAFSSAARWL